MHLAQQHRLFPRLLPGHRHLCCWGCSVVGFFKLCIVLGPNAQILLTQDPDRSALRSLVPCTGICRKLKAAAEARGHSSPSAETWAPAGTGTQALGTEMVRGKVTGREMPGTAAEMLLCRAASCTAGWSAGTSAHSGQPGLHHTGAITALGPLYIVPRLWAGTEALGVSENVSRPYRSILAQKSTGHFYK